MTTTKPNAAAELFADLAALPIAKNSTGQVGNLRYRYLTLPSLIEAVSPVLKKHGAYLRGGTARGGRTLTMTLMQGGERLAGASWALQATGDARARGSEITYARRYLMSLVLGICADEDDDGEAAASTPARTKKAAPPWMDELQACTDGDAAREIYQKYNVGLNASDKAAFMKIGRERGLIK